MLSEKRHTILGRAALGGIAVGAALALSACAPIANILGGGSVEVPEVPEVELETPAEGEDTTAQGPTDTGVFDLNVGDCFIEADMNTAFMSGGVSEIPILSCEEQHDSEIFYAYDIASDTFPGEDAVQTEATSTCQGQIFTDFIGVEYATSEIYVSYLVPTSGSWASGDREVICYAKTLNGELVTGTFEGANR
ncbi:septum formation family protein [Nocardiopsis sp. NPDC050513]|uniref:septum formation family protein n=1 Tax=Nocardiopsis sp. NPDC050513 TaxID=3364338 RepID=UPI00379C5B89